MQFFLWKTEKMVIKRFSKKVTRKVMGDLMMIIHKKTGIILCKFTEKENHSQNFIDK